MTWACENSSLNTVHYGEGAVYTYRCYIKFNKLIKVTPGLCEMEPNDIFIRLNCSLSDPFNRLGSLTIHVYRQDAPGTCGCLIVYHSKIGLPSF